ncbi:MAG: hypothetical protein AB8B95_16260 [Pseudohongiellaceae bacterium]
MLTQTLKTSIVLTALASCFSVSAGAADEPFEGRRVVPILEEPRHRTVYKDGDVYLLDVQINPGDMTLPHTHNAAILYTFISNGEGPLNGRVSGNTDYVENNFTHEVKNEGPGLFRIIALTNYGPGVDLEVDDLPKDVESEIAEENPWFRSYRLTLEAGEETTVQTFANPNVIVQVTEGLIHVTRPDGVTSELTEMGHWAWRKEHVPYSVINLSDKAVEVVINEARR